MNCQYCHKVCQKAGRQLTGIQKYFCTSCKKYQQQGYRYKACQQDQKSLFLKCWRTGNSLSGIQIITRIAVSTQLRWIRRLGKEIKPLTKFELNDTFELDELCTYVQNKGKRRWVISAISRGTGQIIAVKVGARTKKNLSCVVNELLELSPLAIYTDKLPVYRSLIPRHIHKTKQRGINKIERFYLSLRTHIKRLNRRTICYSKKQDVLESLVKLYCFPFGSAHLSSVL